MKQQELLRREAQLEAERRFSEHVNPPDWKNVLRVSDDYDYLRPGFFNAVSRFFAVGVFRLAGDFMAPYCRLRVVGKENLRGVRSAVLTSNHINDIDCVLIKHVLRHRRLRITVGEFNNWRTPIGSLLRAGGTLPFGSTRKTLTNLNAAISTLLQKNSFVLFYPEGSLWWCYEKPRPLLDGAFYSAAKNNAPIVPMFYTFRNIGQRRNSTVVKAFTLHIGEPIYPDPALSVGENTKILRERTFAFHCRIYEEAYGKPAEYLPAVMPST